MTPRPFRLRGEQERRRFLVGLATTPDARSATAALIAATGRGLEARFEFGSQIAVELPDWFATAIPKLANDSMRLGEVHQLTDELTDLFGELLGELSRHEQAAWPMVLLAGVLPAWSAVNGQPQRFTELPYNACQLAETSGINIVSHFTHRDAAVGGRGRPLDALPLWLLARHLDEPRLLIDVRETPCAMWLPAARDPDGPNRIQPANLSHDLPLPQAVQQRLAARAEVQCVVVLGSALDESAIERAHNLEQSLNSAGTCQVLTDKDLWKVSGAALPAVTAAILAMLHQDQTPGNVPGITGAEAPRVLGQLTPGNLLAWNRLQRDLAFARPPIAPLRAAI
jgi:1,6-anhydro-N-acetylmuramate kinase